MVEVRGDWAFMKEVFHFPGWREKSLCCWRCTCTQDQIREVGADAPWRSSRLGHYDLMAKVLSNGHDWSALFRAPWLSSEQFKMDWLHVADHGVSASFLGNVLWLVVKQLPGPNMGAQIACLWERMQRFYADHDVADRLTSLHRTMIRQQSKSPLLRASAAQVRALVPFCKDLAEQVLGNTPEKQAAKVAAAHLHACYRMLARDAPGDWQETLSVSSRLFASQLVALEASRTSVKFWKVSPKLHLFVELCSSGSKPSLCWTYRDEDFGGSCAHMARRRGGLLNCSGTSKSLLYRFMVGQPMIRL